MASTAPLIRVHTPAHVIAAMKAASEVGAAVHLLSSEDAPAFQGRRWFRLVVKDGANSLPGVRATAIVDCGDAPGHALACLEDGGGMVAVSGLAPEVVARLRSIATRLGGGLLEDPAPDLDLLDVPDPLTACRALFHR